MQKMFPLKSLPFKVMATPAIITSGILNPSFFSFFMKTLRLHSGVHALSTVGIPLFKSIFSITGS